MKNSLLLVLTFVFGFSFSQTYDFNYKSKNPKSGIKKIESVSYVFDKKLANYGLSSIEETEINAKGYVTLRSMENIGFSPSRSVTSYHYNKEDKMIYFDNTFKGNDPLRTFYTYKNGKLMEVSDPGKYGYLRKYEYDKNGNLLAEKTTKLDGNSSTEVIYEYFKDNDNYKKATTNFHKGEKTSVAVLEIKNGKNVVDKYISYPKDKAPISTFYTYKYNKNGDATEKKQNTNQFPTTYDFVYDAYGNIIKSHYKEKSIWEETFNHYFYFTKYTYQNGSSTGSTDYDAAFVKKFDK